MSIPYGVYIGKYIEVVSTEKYLIVFRRYPDNRRLESLLLNQDMNCIGICRTVPDGVHPMVLALLDKSILEIKQQESELHIVFEDTTVSKIGTPPDNVKSALLNKKVCHFSQRGASTIIHYKDGSEYSFIAPEQINWEYALSGDEVTASSEEIKGFLDKNLLTIAPDDNGSLSVVFGDGTAYSAESHELFSMEDLTPFCPTTNEASVGECLLKWNVGCTELVYNNRYIGITINTWKHMYIFEITDSSVYCRAARYVTCDKGVVFDQNFRQGFEAYMIEDNRVAMSELDYDENLFSTEACVWNGKSVYWSTAVIGETEIELHGCQGDIYKWTKPKR